MTLGPVDFLTLEFPGNHFKGEILPALLELVDQGLIHIFDLLIIRKDLEGSVLVRNLKQLDEAEMAMLNPLKVEGGQIITRDDIDYIAERLDNNSTAALLLIENLWAKKTKQAILDANGKLLLFDRISHDAIERAQAEMAAEEDAT